jgi:hypothetical protein
MTIVYLYVGRTDEKTVRLLRERVSSLPRSNALLHCVHLFDVRRVLLFFFMSPSSFDVKHRNADVASSPVFISARLNRERCAVKNRYDSDSGKGEMETFGEVRESSKLILDYLILLT